MPLREFFRGLMGFPPRNSDENNNRDVWSSDPFYDLFRDFSAMVDETRRQPPDRAEDLAEEDHHHSGTQDDFSFPVFPEPDEMFRHFEEQFRRTFQGFGLMDFPSGFDRPPLEAPEGSPPAPPGGESGSLRNRMLKPGRGDPEERSDTDLDDRVSDGGLSALLDQREVPPAHQPFSFSSSSSSSSVSVRRFVGPDGRVEERRVETGPDGQRQETVTRRLGDQQQTVVTRRRPDGTSEHEQHLTNLEEGAVQEFERLWQQPAPGRPQTVPDQPQTAPGQHRLGETFWRSLFGW